MSILNKLKGEGPDPKERTTKVSEELTKLLEKHKCVIDVTHTINIIPLKEEEVKKLEEMNK